MKYKLTNETIQHAGKTLYRIQRCDTGELGGYVEHERNLSQDGDAWVFNNAKVFGDAEVYGNAKVFNNAIVYGNAKVCGDAVITKSTQVINIANLRYNITITPQAITIGCMTKTYDEWITVTKKQAVAFGLDQANFKLFKSLLKLCYPQVIKK